MNNERSAQNQLTYLGNVWKTHLGNYKFYSENENHEFPTIWIVMKSNILC